MGTAICWPLFDERLDLAEKRAVEENEVVVVVGEEFDFFQGLFTHRFDMQRPADCHQPQQI